MNSSDAVEFRLILKDEFSRSMGQFKDKLKDADNEIKDSNHLLSELKSSIMAAFGVYEVINFGKELLETTAKFQSFDNMIKFSSINTADFAENQKFLTNEIKNLSLPMEEATAGFAEMAAGMYGTGIEGDKLRNLFDGISTAAATLHLSADSFHNITFALKEIGELGTVQARQMRMLAFALPGAMNLAAQSMHMTTEQFHAAMKKGAINSGEFLQAFSATVKEHFKSGVQTFKDSLQGTMNATSNLWTETMLKIGNDSEGTMKDIMKTIQQVIPIIGQAFTAMMPTIKEWVGYIKDAIVWIIENRKAIETLVKMVAFAYVTFKAFNLLMAASKIVMTAYTVATEIAAGFTIQETLAANGLNAELAIMNTLMAINPFVLIAAGLAVAIGGYELFKSKTDISDQIGQTGELADKWKDAGDAHDKYNQSFGNAKFDIGGALKKQETANDEKKYEDYLKFGFYNGGTGKAIYASTPQDKNGMALDRGHWLALQTSSSPAAKLKNVKSDIVGGGDGKTGESENESSKVTGQKSVTINVSINKLVETIKIMSQTVKEGADISGEHVVKALLSATNQFSASADI